MLRVVPLVPMKEAGRGRALRLEEDGGVLALLGLLTLLLESEFKLTDEGIEIGPCIVGLT